MSKTRIGLAAIALAAIAVAGFIYLRTSTEPAPRKVILYGDSLSVESGRYVHSALNRAGKVAFTNRAISGSAPCDWFDRAVKDAQSNPDAVIIEAFGNNVSPCQLTKAGFRPRSEGDRYWYQYRQGFITLIRQFARTTKIFLTAPPAAYNDMSAHRSHKARMLRTMHRAAEKFSNVTVVDAGRAVERPAGQYIRVLPCRKVEPCSNDPKPGSTYVRAEDGLHFCPPVLKATIESLKHCPVRASGAWRYGTAQAAPVIAALALDGNTTKGKR